MIVQLLACALGCSRLVGPPLGLIRRRQVDVHQVLLLGGRQGLHAREGSRNLSEEGLQTVEGHNQPGLHSTQLLRFWKCLHR